MTYRQLALIAALACYPFALALAQDASMHGSPAMHEAQADAQKPAAGSAEHAGMSQGGSAPADARDPHAYSGGQDFGPVPRPRLADEHAFGALIVDRLERVRTKDATSTAYELLAWYGRDYDRAVLKAEGDAERGKLEEARTELLWSHAVAGYWDAQLGARYDSGAEPDRRWLAFGIQGLAPYWFHVDATAYVGGGGRAALRLAGEYELLLTQRWVLTPRLEGDFLRKDDPERGEGRGLADATAGLRLRYEFRREFAPYVGVEWNGKFGRTADYARAADGRTRETRVVAGVRFWF